MLQYRYTTPRGTVIESAVPMSDLEVREFDEMMDGYADWTDEQYQDWADQMAEEQDQDGYGWERRALANLP